MKRTFFIAVAAAALLAGGAVGQTINQAPQNSPAGVGDQVKQAPRTGDSAQGGGTPSGNVEGGERLSARRASAQRRERAFAATWRNTDIRPPPSPVAWRSAPSFRRKRGSTPPKGWKALALTPTRMSTMRPYWSIRAHAA
jgi:hypothetical protein